MLATSKDVLFPGHYHLLTTGTDDPTLDYRPSISTSNYPSYLAHLNKIGWAAGTVRAEIKKYSNNEKGH